MRAVVWSGWPRPTACACHHPSYRCLPPQHLPPDFSKEMPFDEKLPFGPSQGPAGDPSRPWYSELTRYHWFVLIVAALGWLFDTMDQQLFNLARKPAMHGAAGAPQARGRPRRIVDEYGGYATSIFMIGWAIGGLVFGILGDRIGRAKTMLLTILLYSLFTGPERLVVGFWDFAFYRFLTAWASAASSPSASRWWPRSCPTGPGRSPWAGCRRSRPSATSSAALISIGARADCRRLGSDRRHRAWRAMFVVGVAARPAGHLHLRRKLKEPERWQGAPPSGPERRQKRPEARLTAELFGDPRWRQQHDRRHAPGLRGVVGLWGIGFFSFDLIRTVFTPALPRPARTQSSRRRSTAS